MFSIRPSRFAGSFYPESEKDLAQKLCALYPQKDQPRINGHLKALISPHAGLEYCGYIAAYGYSLLLHEKYNHIMIIGPSHSFRFQNLATSIFSVWQTPLGIIHVSQKANELKTLPFISIVNEAHIDEHCIEVQLPYLQTLCKDFTIIPIVTGKIDNARLVAKGLAPFLTTDTLLIISSDLSHYLPYEEAKVKDSSTIDKIIHKTGYIKEDQACGAAGITILMELARLLNWDAKLLKYGNSGDTGGDKKAVVGYSSIAFYQ